jgi:hypothetical protein
LQVRAGVSDPLVQVAATQTVPLAWSRQAPAPSQPPARRQVEAASAGHSERGSWTEGTAMQAPRDPGILQLRQSWVQASAQQTPSEQIPD